jgi:heme/copper-type cytochrome/quinol oxidase subunit 2
MFTVNPSRTARCIGPGALVAVLVALTACGSPTVSRRVAFIEKEGRTGFDAAAITVTKGDTLKLSVGNRTGTLQDFTVDGLGIERTVEPDRVVTVDIEAKRSGTYRVYSKDDQSLEPLSIVVPA